MDITEWKAFAQKLEEEKQKLKNIEGPKTILGSVWAWDQRNKERGQN